MPNWCNNTMTVSGDPEKVAEFVEQQKAVALDPDGTPIGESLLDFDQVVPMPSVLRNRKSPSDDKSITWYEWAVANWGTKWGACDVGYDYKEGNDTVLYDFSSAWSPPVDWFEKVIEYYPWLDFQLEWEEGGMGFAGKLTGTKGIVGTIEEWTIIWDEEAGEYEVLR